MNKLRVSIYALVAVALMSLPAFGSNQNMQNPSLIDSEGAGAFASNQSLNDNFGIAPSWDSRRSEIQIDRMQNPSLVDSEGAGAFASSQSLNDNYGIAPSWVNQSSDGAEMRLGNPTLQNVFDNVE